MECQKPRTRASSKIKQLPKKKIKEPEHTQDNVLSISVENVENALHEAFKDISVSNEHIDVIYSELDNQQECLNNVIEYQQNLETNVKLSSNFEITENLTVIPSSIPCSVGSLPTPCAPILEDIWSQTDVTCNFEPLKPFDEQELASYYQNTLLTNAYEYIEEFNSIELKNLQTCEHPLYIMLEDYLRARLKVESCKIEINESKILHVTHENHVWTLEPAMYTQYGECKDGNPVSSTKEYQISRFNEKAFDNLQKSLLKLQSLICSYYEYLYECQMIKEKINYYLHQLCEPFSTISINTPVGLFLNSDVRAPDGKSLHHCIHDLKVAISILFAYQRKSICDKIFIRDTRELLQKTVSLLLRVASWKDHIFILNHILRCPSGVGKWASSFVQIPSTEINCLDSNFHLNCIITALGVILMPIKLREQFLEYIYKTEDDKEGIWVVVDSEGEDECSENGQHLLRESDIIALLNQIPFSILFKKMLSENNGNDELKINLWNDSNLLRIIAIANTLVNILKTGLEVYSTNSADYRQFSKRLGQILQDVVNYVTDILEEYKYVSPRVQTEYDALIERTVLCLYDNIDRTTWQYLVMLPFKYISSQTSISLYQYILNLKSGINDCSIEELTDSIVKTSDDECYYILTTINNMALSRDMKDVEFITAVTSSLVKIGFVSITTKEKCKKTCGALLSSLSDKYPFLISDILNVLKIHFDEISSNSMYIFQKLPLSRWKLTEDDLLYIENLILNYAITSIQNTLSRYILTKLFSECDETDINDLMMTKEMHGRIAIIVVKAVLKHSPITTDETSAYYLVHSIKQFVQIKSNEQAFRMWVWKLLYSLKLHLMDLPSLIVCGALQNISHYLLSVIDIEIVNEDTKCLHVEDPIAFYCAVHLTTAGHCVPVIFHKGLDYCYKLLQYKHYTATIACLNVIVPFFFEHSECLLESKKFISIVSGIMADNRSSANRAINILSVQGPSEIIVQFNNMIQYQISNFKHYNLLNQQPVVELWTKIICSLWKEAENDTFVYVLDTIFKNIINTQYLPWARELLANLITQFSDIKENMSAIGSILNFVFQSPDKRSLLLPKYPVVLSNCPYYVLLALEAEEWYIQGRNEIWKQLLIKLRTQQGKANIDVALKKVCSDLKISYFTSGHLSIYRWMQYGLEMPCQQPVAFLYWQNFFRLYLQRVPGTQHNGSVGRKFFEGIVNSSYLTKINIKLKECADFHRTKLKNNPNSEVDLRLARFYEACTLWLFDVRLLEPTLFVPSLDQMYEPNDLTHIINGSNEWLIYLVNQTLVEESKIECSKAWIELLGKDIQIKKNKIQKKHSLVKEPIIRVINRLKSYDSPSPSPELVIRLSEVRILSNDILYQQQDILNIIQFNLKQILDFISNIYRVYTLRHKNLDEWYLDGLKVLYNQIESTTRVQAICDYKTKRSNQSVIKCSGAAEILFQIHEAKLNLDVQEVNLNNRKELDTLINTTLELLLPPSLTIACTTLNLITQQIISELAALSKVGDIALMSKLKSSGVQIFYKIIKDYEILKTCPAIETFILVILQSIGKVFISNNEKECLHIMNTALTYQNLSDVLVPLFSPSSTSSKTFLEAYKNIIQHCNAQYEPIALKLLSQFDVATYLSIRQPLLQERSVLINHCMDALIMIKQQTKTDYTTSVHELFTQHLCKMMDHDFPEHYGEILLKLLEHCKEGKIYSHVWFYILNTILAQAVPLTPTESKRTILLPDMSIEQLRDIVRRYATDQRSLNSQQLQETLHLLTTHFANERLKSATGELYSKYNSYVEPLIYLYAMVGHALIVGTLQTYRGMLANQICEFLCPTLISMFGPWLEPWYEGWNTENKTLKFPWLATNTAVATLMTNTLVECILFVLDTMPACDNVLSYICQWYIKLYAHMQITDNIFEVIHSSLAKLPWKRFMPIDVDIELIMKVMDQFLPQSHCFLADIIIEVPWPYVQKIDIRTLFSLFIKVSNLPNMRKDSKIRPILLEVQKFPWHQIDGEYYENILSWFVSKYDPLTVLQLTNEDWCGTDSAVLDLLKLGAGYNEVDQNIPYAEHMSYKRRVFIRAMVKMFVSLTLRYRSILGSHYRHLKCSFSRLMDEIEMVTKHGEEAKLLIIELLALINQSSGSVLSSLMLQTIQEWIVKRKANSTVMEGLLMATWSHVTELQYKSDILEACLTAWFKNSGNEEEFKWDKVLTLLPSVHLHYQGLAEILMSSSHLLTLYALALKESQNQSSYSDILITLVQCLESVKPNNISENKLPLIWSLTLRLSSFEDDHTSNYLLRISAAANQLAQFKQSWSLFDAIRLQKQTNITTKCRVLCRALAAFIHAQLPENKSSRKQFIRQDANAPGGFSSNNNDFVTSMECLKATCALEALKQDRQYSDCNIAIDIAIKDIKGSHSCMKYGEQFVIKLAKCLYTDNFIHGIIPL
ncbi:ectopic P granules protein 5 homolog isoform X2 [Daktulosphaira vitifoliae]|uniref:ectopic P granules protein 5 homolog isoform X2 n=1 Tax=Daktulosphaira vitifoliae TaxID=58002 RepID=UPI0021AA0EAE|nr:ectopic P granules protein 5 homolog isoform X2 [Daktulosphaira vitifoliae]